MKTETTTLEPPPIPAGGACELNQLAESIHALAREKGWYEEPEPDDQFIARTISNIHAEVSELWENYRKGELFTACDKTEQMIAQGMPPLPYLEEALADLVIRALDTAQRLEIDTDLRPEHFILALRRRVFSSRATVVSFRQPAISNARPVMASDNWNIPAQRKKCRGPQGLNRMIRGRSQHQTPHSS